jgi:hypothetical protein
MQTNQSSASNSFISCLDTDFQIIRKKSLCIMLIVTVTSTLALTGCGGDAKNNDAPANQNATKDIPNKPTDEAKPIANKDAIDDIKPDEIKPDEITSHDQAAEKAMELTNQVIATLETIKDKESALATLAPLQQIVLQAKDLNTQWLAIGIPTKEEMAQLKENHSDKLKASAIDAGKTLVTLAKRWKVGEIKAGYATLIKITKAVNDICKSVSLFGKQKDE